MKKKTVKDANGQPYEAYVGYTKKGTEVAVDKTLADLCDSPSALLAAEIRAYEESGG